VAATAEPGGWRRARRRRRHHESRYFINVMGSAQLRMRPPRVRAAAYALINLSDIIDVANRVATVDGPVNELERAVISELRDHCRRA
jgi:hypothetical protein